MKEELGMKDKAESVAYSGIVIFLFGFSLLVLACLVLTVGGTTLQLLF